eukprot:272223_1
MCDYITIYCLYLIPFLYFITWFSILKRIIQNLRYNSELLLIIFVSNIATPFWNWLFVYHLKIGYLGTAITINVDMFCSVFLCVLFLCYKGHGSIFKPLPLGRIIKYNAVKQYLTLTLPGLATMCSSWWIGELIIILSGFIANPTISVASTVVVYSIYEIALWVSIALGNSVNIRIGKYIGFGSIKYAQLSAKVASLLGFIFIVNLTLVLIVLKDYIPKLYSNNYNVEAQSSKLMYCIVLVLISGTMYRLLNGIFYGLGYPMTVALILFVAQDIISLGLIFIWLFPMGYKKYANIGLQVIWLWTAFGFLLASIGLIIVLIYKGKRIWNNAVIDSKKRIEISLQRKPLNQNKKTLITYASMQSSTYQKIVKYCK